MAYLNLPNPRSASPEQIADAIGWLEAALGHLDEVAEEAIDDMMAAYRHRGFPPLFTPEQFLDELKAALDPEAIEARRHEERIELLAEHVGVAQAVAIARAAEAA